MKIEKSTTALRALLVVAGVSALASCGGGSKFKVEGTIDGGNGESVVLEKPGFHGEWNAIDSTHLSKDGSFSMKAARPAAPEIYRLRIDSRYIYFPIDSTETVSVSSRIEEFGHQYDLAGSEKAEALARFERDFARFGASPASPDSTASFKRRVYTEYMQPAPGSIVTYHILTKTMADGKPLYDVAGSSDYRYLAAVATGFKEMRPDDPHTSMLEAYAVEALKQKNRERGIHKEVQAPEISLLPIALHDENGNLKSLSDIAGKGEPVILVFSPLNDAEAPARNKELMDRYRRGGIRIYHVSYDRDQYAWREAAANLPWTTVIDPSASPKSVIDYNISTLPAYFLIDAGGNLVKRADRLGDL